MTEHDYSCLGIKDLRCGCCPTNDEALDGHPTWAVLGTRLVTFTPADEESRERLERLYVLFN
ncbi:hypothetical protein [Streptomyces sp. Amel2xC10]|uniref:hypothetical protein n=1 Tax=Streptomyces sp. Amel2xC10 TaxID=1305826 RepID=UPI000A08C3EA|nr:hypothetical protein [Streptomyces sp. Amel2xC10]SMF01597.1 hypothetical protein SAMN02745830_01081 [Streptomyces sp. Amel2xC10]